MNADDVLPGSKDPLRLTIDRIFHEKEFELKGYDARWIEETNDFTVLREIEQDGDESVHLIQKYISGEDKFETIFSSKELFQPEDKSDPPKIDGYAFSKDQTKLLIYTNAQRVWRQNTRGDYWLFDCDTRKLVQLGGDAPSATMMFAKLSPDATQLAFVRERNVYIEDLANHQIRNITQSENEHIINGTADWVYEEEFHVRDGFCWSPDGKHIAYWQIDTTGVGQFPLVNNIDSRYPEVTWFAYPKVGERNPACRIGVANCQSGKTEWITLPGDSREHYVARMQWAGNSDEILVQQLNRLQNRNQLFLANIHSGSVVNSVNEQDEAWVDVHDELFWIDDGKKFTWLSERDGWRHLYIASRTGLDLDLVTPGDYDVIKLLKVDEPNKCFYFIASPNDATQRFLFRGDLETGTINRLTPADQTGVHEYSFSDDCSIAIHRSSNINSPGLTELISIPDHRRIRLLEDNVEVGDRVAQLANQPVEFFQVDIGDGVELDSWCIKPPDFDPARQYPLLIYVYGEPAGTTVVNQWGKTNQLWHFMLAQHGYVVMSFDNRGTHAPRGREFRKCIYQKIGILPPQDQAAAVKAVLRDRSYLDPARVGIWGWSGGGSSSLQAIFKYPDLYSTSIAIASVPDQRYYDTIYQERYMGLPQDSPDVFEQGSPINFAEHLEGNLLLIHGTGDDNCHYQTAELLIDKLIACNKQFSLMVYPNRTHAIKERDNTERHLRQLMTEFLLKHLPPQK